MSLSMHAHHYQMHLEKSKTHGKGNKNYKTVPCARYAHGHCEYEDDCWFIHEPDEATRAVSRYNSMISSLWSSTDSSSATSDRFSSFAMPAATAPVTVGSPASAHASAFRPPPPPIPISPSSNRDYSNSSLDFTFRPSPSSFMPTLVRRSSLASSASSSNPSSLIDTLPWRPSIALSSSPHLTSSPFVSGSSSLPPIPPRLNLNTNVPRDLPCFAFQHRGHCSKGDLCLYRHDSSISASAMSSSPASSAQSSPSRARLSAKQPCFDLMRTKTCPKGDDCVFSHEGTDRYIQWYKDVTCKLYPQGKCKHGSTCLFKHVQPTVNIDATVGHGRPSASTGAAGFELEDEGGYAIPRQASASSLASPYSPLGWGRRHSADDPFAIDAEHRSLVQSLRLPSPLTVAISQAGFEPDDLYSVHPSVSVNTSRGLGIGLRDPSSSHFSSDRQRLASPSIPSPTFGANLSLNLNLSPSNPHPNSHPHVNALLSGPLPKSNAASQTQSLAIRPQAHSQTYYSSSLAPPSSFPPSSFAFASSPLATSPSELSNTRLGHSFALGSGSASLHRSKTGSTSSISSSSSGSGYGTTSSSSHNSATTSSVGVGQQVPKSTTKPFSGVSLGLAGHGLGLETRTSINSTVNDRHYHSTAGSSSEGIRRGVGYSLASSSGAHFRTADEFGVNVNGGNSPLYGEIPLPSSFHPRASLNGAVSRSGHSNRGALTGGHEIDALTTEMRDLRVHPHYSTHSLPSHRLAQQHQHQHPHARAHAHPDDPLGIMRFVDEEDDILYRRD